MPRTPVTCRRARVSFRHIVFDKTTFVRRDASWWAPVAIFTLLGDAKDFVDKQPDLIKTYLQIRTIETE